MEIPQTQNQMILAAMHGEHTEFKASDLRNIVTIYHDNTKATELVSQADMWLGRYEHGYSYGSHIVNACLNCIRNKKDKLEYPRTYVLIHKAKNPGKDDSKKSGGSKRKAPNVKILGFKK